MIKELEKPFQDINDILAQYTADDTYINKVKALLVHVQTYLNPLPDECEFFNTCGEEYCRVHGIDYHD